MTPSVREFGMRLAGIHSLLLRERNNIIREGANSTTIAEVILDIEGLAQDCNVQLYSLGATPENNILGQEKILGAR